MRFRGKLKYRVHKAPLRFHLEFHFPFHFHATFVCSWPRFIHTAVLFILSKIVKWPIPIPMPMASAGVLLQAYLINHGQLWLIARRRTVPGRQYLFVGRFKAFVYFSLYLSCFLLKFSTLNKQECKMPLKIFLVVVAESNCWRLDATWKCIPTWGNLPL